MGNETGERYARATGRKGVGQEGEMDWLIKDMSEELKLWGHQGGENGKVIAKCYKESSVITLRDAIGKYHGGCFIPESPPKGESQANGCVEESVRIVREYTRVFKEQLEDKAGMKIQSNAAITQWMVR